MKRHTRESKNTSPQFGIRNSEFGISAPSAGNAESGKAALKAVFWVLVGAAVMLVLVVDPIGFSPVDNWFGIARSADIGDGNGDGLWTCGMHPEVIQEEPGICPICHMDLTPLRMDDSSDDAAEHAGHEDGLFTCPMHPDIIEEEPGSCPICGMDLVPTKG